ncbi:MAG: hemolysin III family protein [Chloroflexi bacterium]|nr:hemolysin III family protein [Chloroflexota bacterium]MDA1227135.1 hemolysin III family protein [Chloroflexota bacterium]
MDARINSATRPLLRGYLHLVAAIVTPFALVLLLLIADSPQGYAGAAVFGTSLILMYTASAMYHLTPLESSHLGVLRRFDHSMIFFLIGGTYTPFALKILDNAWGISILSVVWGLAGIGIILKLTLPQAPRWLGVSIYILIGWIGLIPFVQIANALPIEANFLLTAGGLTYTLGSLMYLFRWPNPFPQAFGFHEVFHLMVVMASSMFYLVVAAYVLPM